MPAASIWRQSWVVFLAAFIGGLIAYYPGLRAGPFAVDDLIYLGSFPSVSAGLDAWLSILGLVPRAVFLPLTDSSTLITTRLAGIFGTNPLTALRWVHLGVQSLSAIWISQIAFLFTQKSRTALFAGILFALHPVHTFAVLWISSGKDIWVTFWMLLSALLYLKSHKPWALVTFVLALLSKQSAYGLLLFFYGVELNLGIVSGMSFPKAAILAWRRTWGFFAIAGLVLLVIISRSYHNATLVPIWQKTYPLLKFYFGKLLWPDPLTHYYPIPRSWSPALVGATTTGTLLLLVGQGFRLSQPIRLCLLLGLSFILPYVVVVPNTLWVTNTYAYAWVAFPILLLACITRKMKESLLILISSLLILLCVGLSHRQARNWNEMVASFEQNASLYPGDYAIQNRVGQILEHHQQHNLAKNYYTRALMLKKQQEAQSSFFALDGLVRLAGTDQSQVFQSLDQIVSTDNAATGCQNLAEHLSERGLKIESHLPQCLARYPAHTQEAWHQVQDIEHQMHLGQSLERRRQFAGAKKAYRRVLIANSRGEAPIQREAFRGLAQIAALERDWSSLRRLDSTSQGDLNLCADLARELQKFHLVQEFQLQRCPH